MEKEPHRLQEIRGISQKMALEMSAKLRNLTTMRELIDYIGSFGLPPEYASRLYGLFGMKALDRLQENPYLLCSESVGASFMQADQVAMELGYSEENSERLMAAALYELRYNCARGHCFIPFEKLSDAASRLTGMDTESVDAALEELIARGDVEQERIEICGPATCMPTGRPRRTAPPALRRCRGTCGKLRKRPTSRRSSRRWKANSRFPIPTCRKKRWILYCGTERLS